jgi:hypothetical protein
MSSENSTLSPTGAHSNDPIAIPIHLVDHTKEASDADQPPPDAGEEDDAQRNKSIASQSSPLSPKTTRVSLNLREEISRRKWAKYQEDRTASHKRKRSTGSTLSPPTTPVDASSGIANAAEEDEDEEEFEDTWGESTIQRGLRHSKHAKERARELLPKLHTEHHSNHPDFIAHQQRHFKEKQRNAEEEAIDILYENQRGWFAFGVPLFSSKSLLQCDPSPWLDKEFRPSGFDIRDAQVPDPSWRWDWKTWYVDMSRDVDEEGWEYAFMFRKYVGPSQYMNISVC